MVSELQGSYKIREDLLYKLVSKKITDINGAVCESASSLELMTIIYLTQISDIRGTVKEFKVSDLEYILGCTKRTTYVIINNLEKKGFISVSGNSWTGIKTIRILNNDFEGITDYKENKYLNTNQQFLIPGTSENESFKKLSLYAKRTLLIVMFKYNYNYGYRASIDTIKELLGIKERAKVSDYMEEINPLINEFSDKEAYQITKDTKKRLKYGFITLESKMHMLLVNHGIEDGQDSFFKHSWKQLLKKEHIIDDNLYILNKNNDTNRLLGILYSGINVFLESSSYDICTQICLKTFHDLGVLNEYTVRMAIENIKATAQQEKNKSA